MHFCYQMIMFRDDPGIIKTALITLDQYSVKLISNVSPNDISYLKTNLNTR